jgi:dynein regulatory complex protein 1
VLKKRDEENTITVTTQKRRINRLNDTVNALRQKVAKQEESYRKEYHQLSDEYSRILSQFKEFKQKFFRFQSSDDKIFNDVWNMNKHEAEEMISKVLTADKIIWHKHLGSAWRKPAAFENLQQRKQSAELTQSGSSLPPEIQPKVFSHEEFQKLFSNKQTKEALSLMVDECAPILVEERLQKLLAIIPGEEQKLMKLDCIFKAMRITAIDDVHLLETYFFKDDKLIPAQHTMRAILQFLDDRAAKEAASEDNAPVDTIFVRKSEEGESEDEASMNYWKALRDIVSNKSFVQWDVCFSISCKISMLIASIVDY